MLFYACKKSKIKAVTETAKVKDFKRYFENERRE